MSNSEKSPILVVGSVARSTRIHNARLGSHARVLGGSAVYASLAASKFFATPVRLVGVVGKDFPDAEAVDMLRKTQRR